MDENEAILHFIYIIIPKIYNKTEKDKKALEIIKKKLSVKEVDQ